MLRQKKGISAQSEIGRRLRDERRDRFLSQDELSLKIADLLRPEVMAGLTLERLRVERGYTQEELTQRMNIILGEIASNGPPSRMALSKVERGRRRIDLLEGLAAAIALEVDIWQLVPEELAVLRRDRPVSPMSLWHLLPGHDGQCYTFRHRDRQQLLTLVPAEPLKIPADAARRTVSLCQIIEINPAIADLPLESFAHAA